MTNKDSENRSKIIDQHFWFTATAMGINGFLISNHSNVKYSIITGIWISMINLFFCYLILQRSAYHAGKIKVPEKLNGISQSDRGFKDKLLETRLNFKTVLKHIPFVIGEFSGTLMYLLLVITSFIGFLSICFF